MEIQLNRRYRISKDVITREIEGDLVIVPIIDGVGNLDSEMYSLNRTGATVWNKFDGDTSLEDIIKDLSEEYDAPCEKIKADVLEILQALLKEGLVVEV